MERKGNTHTCPHTQQIIQNVTYTAQTSTCCSYSTIGATIRPVVIIIIDSNEKSVTIYLLSLCFKTCMPDFPQWGTNKNILNNVMWSIFSMQLSRNAVDNKYSEAMVVVFPQQHLWFTTIILHKIARIFFNNSPFVCHRSQEDLGL